MFFMVVVKIIVNDCDRKENVFGSDQLFFNDVQSAKIDMFSFDQKECYDTVMDETNEKFEKIETNITHNQPETTKKLEPIIKIDFDPKKNEKYKIKINNIKPINNTNKVNTNKVKYKKNATNT